MSHSSRRIVIIVRRGPLLVSSGRCAYHVAEASHCGKLKKYWLVIAVYVAILRFALPFRNTYSVQCFRINTPSISLVNIERLNSRFHPFSPYCAWCNAPYFSRVVAFALGSVHCLHSFAWIIDTGMFVIVLAAVHPLNARHQISGGTVLLPCCHPLQRSQRNYERVRILKRRRLFLYWHIVYTIALFDRSSMTRILYALQSKLFNQRSLPGRMLHANHFINRVASLWEPFPSFCPLDKAPPVDTLLEEFFPVRGSGRVE